MPVINASGQFIADQTLETTELAHDGELPDALPETPRVTLPFPGFADGRAFSLARELRARGYKGVIRATGKLNHHQLRHALACGFDEVEISDEQAERQPQEVWQRAAQSRLPDYQSRLGQRA